MNTTHQNNPKNAAAKVVPTKNLLDTIAANGNFKVFADAVEKAGLVDTLNGAGPYTLFAPTDAAFAKLPDGRLENLLKVENKAELISILNYHLLKGNKTVAEIGKWDSARMVQGQSAPIRMSEGKFTLDGACVSEADIASSNGMLHGLDTVNIPNVAPVTVTKN
jgi:uncharacterized surface protein with fasciclin (FAS1) repeats